MEPPEDELKTRVMAETEAALERLLARRKPAEEITLTEIEELMIEASQEIKARLTQVLVDASVEGQTVPGPSCEVCGKEMHYKGRREKRVITQTGEVRISRPYYYCQTCERGVFPLDERWQLSSGAYSNGMSREMVWLSGVVPSYQQAEKVFARIGHQHVPHSSIWRRSQAHGERLKDYVEQQQAHVKPERVVIPKVDQDHNTTKGVTMDGGMVHIRNEGWKEFKAGAVFDVEIGLVRDRETGEEVERPCAVNTNYTAVLGAVERFAPALWHLAVQADVPTAARSSVTADGAAWIWNLAADYFPDSEQIVDWYHATEHLAEAAHALHPDDADKATAWYKRWQEPLFEGEAWRLAQTLARADLPDQATYFENHKRRMRYQHFRADGFPIGSGTIESACKQFKARLTGPGMRWSRPGAERMLVIRSAVMGDDFDALWDAPA